MDKRIKRYHRFIYHEKGECVLYEPCKNNFIWITMYIEPEYRCSNLSHVLFKYIIHKLKGIHHIHCNPRIKPFRQLSITYKWKFKGISEFFDKCSYYRYCSKNSNGKYRHSVNIAHETLRRRPDFKSVINKNHSKRIIELINQDFKKCI